VSLRVDSGLDCGPVVRSRDGMVDITDLKSVADRRTGSSPVGSTILKSLYNLETLTTAMYNTMYILISTGKRLKMSILIVTPVYNQLKCMIHKTNHQLQQEF
jgi:hypothetical protein